MTITVLILSIGAALLALRARRRMDRADLPAGSVRALQRAYRRNRADLSATRMSRATRP